MRQSRIIMTGAGNVGRELLKKLPREVHITCIDTDPEAEEAARQIRADIDFIRGDATSRLVLEKAEVDSADVVILSTTTEKINVETARVLHEHFNAKRVISVGITETGIKTMESYDVEIENIFTASAIGIRNRLEHKTRTAHGIGLGKDEILEVEVHPNSRFANRSMRTISPVRWRIGILYRDENILVPNADTVLKPHDRLVILGEPSALKTVTEILTFSFLRFPLEYGSSAVVYVSGREEDSFFEEIGYAALVFPIEKWTVVYMGKALSDADRIDSLIEKQSLRNLDVIHARHDPEKAMIESLDSLSGPPGLVCLSKKDFFRGGLPFLGSGRKGFLKSLMKRAACPVIFSMGSFPYEKAAVPSIPHAPLHHVLESSIEISSLLHNSVTALLVQPSGYISSEDDVEDFKGMQKIVKDLGSMYKKSIETRLLRGNPVKTVISELSGYQLLIMGAGRLGGGMIKSLLSPDIVWHITKGSPVSTLLLPGVEDSL